MTGLAQAVITVAESQVGYHEGKDGAGNWDNIQKYSDQVPGLQWSQGQPWCAVFASWCALKAGAASLFPSTAACAEGVAWFQAENRWSVYPAVGAQVFYGSGGGSHTGIVEHYDADWIYTIEGNTNVNGSAEGDGVYRRTRARRDPYVFGYGYPAYPGGIVSADPAYNDQQPPPVAPGGPYAAFPGAAWFHGAPNSPVVTSMGWRLVAQGCSAYQVGPGPQWTDSDRFSYQKWQQKLGYRGADADGWPGAVSWGKLDVPAA
jgi:hypothetical protein